MITKYLHSINNKIYELFYPISSVKELLLYYSHLIIVFGGLYLFFPLNQLSGIIGIIVFLIVFLIYVVLIYGAFYFREKYYVPYLYKKNYNCERFNSWIKMTRSKKYKLKKIESDYMNLTRYKKSNLVKQLYVKEIRVRRFLHFASSYIEKRIILVLSFDGDFDFHSISNDFYPKEDIYLFRFISGNENNRNNLMSVTTQKNRQISIQDVYVDDGSITVTKPYYIHKTNKETVRKFLISKDQNESLIFDFHLSRVISYEFFKLFRTGLLKLCKIKWRVY